MEAEKDDNNELPPPSSKKLPEDLDVASTFSNQSNEDTMANETTILDKEDKELDTNDQPLMEEDDEEGKKRNNEDRAADMTNLNTSFEEAEEDAASDEEKHLPNPRSWLIYQKSRSPTKKT